MELKDFLTNETIKKRFDNQFDLVNYAIAIAKDMILAGRAPRIKTQTENPALLVLEEIVAGKDSFEPKEERAQIQVEDYKEIHTTLTEVEEDLEEEDVEEEPLLKE